jgi:glutamyl/glutaminyl-tRNA synthetase
MAWHPDAEREIYDVDELIRLFRIEDVRGASPIFDLEKLTWLNGVYMRRLIEHDPDRVVDLCAQILQREGLLESELTPDRRRYLERVIQVVGDRLKVGRDIIAYADFFFRDVIYDEDAVKKYLTPEAATLLTAFADALAAPQSFPLNKRGLSEPCARYVRGRAWKPASWFIPCGLR